jgi:adenylylsulfate kinase
LDILETSHEDIEKMFFQKGTVIWLTGLPCSGKTTIATRLQGLLIRMNRAAYVLDGDKIRKGLNSDLGFSKEGRIENIRRIGEVAKLFADTGFIIIVAFISPFRQGRNQIRSYLPIGQFIEVYLDCPIEECEKRDVKGHYKQARNGKIAEFTGVSSPYEPPLKPELQLKTNIQSLVDCTDEIVDYLIKLERIPKEL